MFITDGLNKELKGFYFHGTADFRVKKNLRDYLVQLG